LYHGLILGKTHVVPFERKFKSMRIQVVFLDLGKMRTHINESFTTLHAKGGLIKGKPKLARKGF